MSRKEKPDARPSRLEAPVAAGAHGAAAREARAVHAGAVPSAAWLAAGGAR